MTDLKRKTEIIHSIEQLQLSKQLIIALDDAHQAIAVSEAIHHLQDLVDHWH